VPGTVGNAGKLFAAAPVFGGAPCPKNACRKAAAKMSIFPVSVRYKVKNPIAIMIALLVSFILETKLAQGKRQTLFFLAGNPCASKL